MKPIKPNMKPFKPNMRLYTLLWLLMLVSISYGQTITKELKVISKDYEIEVLKTRLSEIRQTFKNDSIVEGEFDGVLISL